MTVIAIGTSNDNLALAALSHVAVIGNALPRRCGLATFTSHTVTALRERFPDLRVDHYAMDDSTGVTYPADIRLIDAATPAAYREAAGLIEASGAEAIWLQHEFGIFGGEAGREILGLLDRSTLPVVTTLHTVLENPSAAEREVTDRLIARSAHLIVMAESGRRILLDTYRVAPERISVIGHGVPDRAYVMPDDVKPRFDLAGRKVVMTFGLLGPDKGVRDMIEAMPAVVSAVPNAVYLVLGATHPNIVRDHGEAYRQSLIARTHELGVSDNVQFIDTFLEQEDLLDRLEAVDVYVTPYHNMAQVTSGTLSYAVSLGKPVVSTPYVHARELLGDGVGILVPPRDPAALAAEVGRLLADDAGRTATAARAYAHGRDMIWSRTAERAVALIARARAAGQRLIAAAPLRAPLTADLGAVRRMTDSTGIIQHGLFSIPDRNHGYCIDDNARGLILACRADGADDLATTYAAFVQHAWNPDTGRFRNFMRFDRSWCEDEGSEDSNGRALWSLGVAASTAPDRAMRDWAINLYDQTAGLAARLGSPRAQAFAVLGAAEVLSVHAGHGLARSIVADAVSRLELLWTAHARDDWCWFEPVLAYDNARLPEAMIRAGVALGRDDVLQRGLESLGWLIDVQTGPDGAFRPVGTDSFGRAYSSPLPFDQQPLESQATIDACVAAHAATGDARWTAAARHAYDWFVGGNMLGLPMADRRDGGCHDGLMPHGINRNQGAESILALQLSNVAISALSFGSGTAKTARGAA